MKGRSHGGGGVGRAPGTGSRQFVGRFEKTVVFGEEKPRQPFVVEVGVGKGDASTDAWTFFGIHFDRVQTARGSGGGRDGWSGLKYEGEREGGESTTGI